LSQLGRANTSPSRDDLSQARVGTHHCFIRIRHSQAPTIPPTLFPNTCLCVRTSLSPSGVRSLPCASSRDRLVQLAATDFSGPALRPDLANRWTQPGASETPRSVSGARWPSEHAERSDDRRTPGGPYLRAGSPGGPGQVGGARQLKRHKDVTVGREFLVHGPPIGDRPQGLQLRRRCREQPPLHRLLVEVVPQRPGNPGRLSTMQLLIHGGRPRPDSGSDIPNGPTLGLQPQSLTDLPHRQALLGTSVPR
jgi:hypothetical protein